MLCVIMHQLLDAIRSPLVQHRVVLPEVFIGSINLTIFLKRKKDNPLL